MIQLGNGLGVLCGMLLFQAAFIFYTVCFQGFDHFCFDELCKGLKGFLKTLIGLYYSRNFVLRESNARRSQVLEPLKVIRVPCLCVLVFVPRLCLLYLWLTRLFQARGKKKLLLEFAINTDKYTTMQGTVQKSIECIIFNSKYRTKNPIFFLVIILPFPVGNYKAIKIIAEGIFDRMHLHARKVCLCFLVGNFCLN